MYLQTLIVSVLLVAIVMLALGVKLLFNKDADFQLHSCAFDGNKNIDKEMDCSSCQLKEVADCSEAK